MVRAIPFGKLQKVWAVAGDAIFLLFEVSLADVDIFYGYMDIFYGDSPQPRILLFSLCLRLKFPTGWFL